MTALPATVADTANLLSSNGYIADLELATTVHLALAMQRPLLLEGEPGTVEDAVRALPLAKAGLLSIETFPLHPMDI